MSSLDDGRSGPRILQWFLDTRPLWQVPSSQAGSRSEVQQLRTVAARELSLLTSLEQEAVLRFYHLRDAKLALASHLLKHLVVTKYGAVKWPQSAITRDSKKKPCYVPSSPGGTNVDFNVSHQAGIVSLIAAVEFKEPVAVGTDVVCWNERTKFDYVHIEKNGLFDWIEMHADVFANSEIQHMKSGPLQLQIEKSIIKSTANDAISKCEQRGGTLVVTVKEGNEQKDIRVEQDLIVDAKLRRFHAMWCLREAYVKMTGDALVAPWLKELEILDVQAPEVAKGVISADSLEPGKVSRDFPIFFKGQKVLDVEMEVSAIGQNFMIGGAVRRPPQVVNDLAARLGQWQELRLKDILAFAELNV